MNEIFSGQSRTRPFLNNYWQKRPWFRRRALPEIGQMIDRAQLMRLACRDDVESRLVVGANNQREVRHGPFRQRDFARLPARNWTLLVNGVENFVAAAREVQCRFGFVPYSRHDDIMISYAAPGGGVGPHFDSYDVFLVQGRGRRRWQIGRQKDLTLVPEAELRILKNFQPQREWVTADGDLLYLPPRYAHHGVALDDCITWSVGMRAAGRQEMAARFLDFLHDRLQLNGDYRDPGLRPQRHPARISAAMLHQFKASANETRWTDADVACCVGEYLTEPRPNIIFSAAPRMSEARFRQWIEKHGVRLDLKSRMLVASGMAFINGESAGVGARAMRLLQRLADDRELEPGTRLDAATAALLYQWYRAGYVESGKHVRDR